METTPFPDRKGALWSYSVPDKSQNSNEWYAEQVWGYAEHDIPGSGREKRYTRKIHFISPTLTKDVLLIYDQKDTGTTTSAASNEDEDLASFGST